jgi:hypothetical protein
MDSTLPLLNALDKVVEQSCKIGRDKINAALGLIDKAQARRIIPDYTKSLREILVDVAVCCLNQDEVAHRLDFLGCLAPPPHQAVSEFPGTLLKIPPATQPLVYWLPSWLPDWTRGTTKPWDRCGSRMRLPYAFTTEFCHSVYHPHVTDGKFLHLHGWRKDYVDIIRPVPFGYLKDLCSRHPFRDELNTVFDIASFAEISGVGVPPQLVEVFSKMFQPSMMPSMGALITDNMYDIFAQYQWLPATTKGLGFGIFPTRAKKGDVICSFIGGSVYYVLRSTGHNPDTYNFIGEAYMFGEMKSLQGEGPPEKFTLV